MIHVAWSTRYRDEDFQRALAQSWRAGALYFYARWYNFDEHSEEEWALIKGWREQLLKTMPDEYRTGVHLIAEEHAFMGEDIFVVDGDIQHTGHCKCTVCGGFQMVSRGEHPNMWCVPCNGYQKPNFNITEE